jgi:hypothetical protein
MPCTPQNESCIQIQNQHSGIDSAGKVASVRGLHLWIDDWIAQIQQALIVLLAVLPPLDCFFMEVGHEKAPSARGA